MNVIRLYCEMVLAPAHTLSMQIAYSENSLTRYSRHERTPRVSEEKKTRPLRGKEEGSLGAGGSNMAVEGNIRPYFPNWNLIISQGEVGPLRKTHALPLPLPSHLPQPRTPQLPSRPTQTTGYPTQIQVSLPRLRLIIWEVISGPSKRHFGMSFRVPILSLMLRISACPGPAGERRTTPLAAGMRPYDAWPPVHSSGAPSRKLTSSSCLLHAPQHLWACESRGQRRNAPI